MRVGVRVRVEVGFDLLAVPQLHPRLHTHLLAQENVVHREGRGGAQRELAEVQEEKLRNEILASNAAKEFYRDWRVKEEDLEFLGDKPLAKGAEGEVWLGRLHRHEVMPSPPANPAPSTK